MYIYHLPFHRDPLVRPTQPIAPPKNPPQRLPLVSTLASRKNRRAGDLERLTTWSNLLATRRLIIQAELTSIAGKPSDAEVPECSLRMGRISIAMYLLGRAGAIIRKTSDQVPYQLWPPLLHVAQLLEKPFFTEPQHLVLFHYDEIKASLEAQGFYILKVDAAARKYINHVKKRVAQMRHSRQGPPKDVDVMA